MTQSEETEDSLDHYMDPSSHGEVPPPQVPVEMLVEEATVALAQNLARAEEHLRRHRPAWFEKGKDTLLRGAPVIGIAAVVGAAAIIGAVKAFQHYRGRRADQGRPKAEG